MPTAYIETPDCRVSLRSQRLVVQERVAAGCDPSPRQTIPLCHLERLVLNERAQITTQALATLLNAGIPVMLTSARGRFIGGCWGEANPAGATRLLQYRRTTNAEFALAIATKVVRAKIHNQRRLLQRLAQNRAGDFGDDLAMIETLGKRSAYARTIGQLRGYEGAASASYFRAWAVFLPAEFPFERRSAHPPRDAVNACISLAATFIYHELVSRLHTHGLDPALGLLHASDNRRWSLALDLMEPYRPCVVEALTLYLLSHRLLRLEHFEQKGSATWLNAAGRDIFLRHYERRVMQEIYSEHRGHRTTLRREFDRAALDFLGALKTPAAYAPFTMN